VGAVDMEVRRADAAFTDKVNGNTDSISEHIRNKFGCFTWFGEMRMMQPSDFHGQFVGFVEYSNRADIGMPCWYQERCRRACGIGQIGVSAQRSKAVRKLLQRRCHTSMFKT